MITDKQHREVAERLRRQAHWMNKSKDWYDKDDVDQGNRAYRNIADSVEEGSNFGNHYEETVRKLADLIDRPTCHDTGERVNSFTCSSCGFYEEKIAFNPFTYSFRGLKPDWNYCPNCDAEVVE